MTQSRRKFIGTMLTLASLVVWPAGATWLYLSLLEGRPWFVLIPFFLVAGLTWLWPSMAIIRWMAKPD